MRLYQYAFLKFFLRLAILSFFFLFAVIEMKSEDRGKFFDALSALLIPKWTLPTSSHILYNPFAKIMYDSLRRVWFLFETFFQQRSPEWPTGIRHKKSKLKFLLGWTQRVNISQWKGLTELVHTHWNSMPVDNSKLMRCILIVAGRMAHSRLLTMNWTFVTTKSIFLAFPVENNHTNLGLNDISKNSLSLWRFCQPHCSM